MAGLLAVSRVKFFGEKPEELATTYPDAASQRPITMMIEAATRVAELNYEHFTQHGVAPVSAALTDDAIVIIDPLGHHHRETLYVRDGATVPSILRTSHRSEHSNKREH